MNKGTLKQQEAARIALESIANGNKLTKGEILKKADYPEIIQNNPSRVFDSEGFKNAIKELSTALHIDKDSRLLRLAELFWTSKSAKDVAIINKEIANMQGDYVPVQAEIKDFRTNRDNLVKPE